MLASFAGSTDYTSGAASTTFTISQATPTVTVTRYGGTYNGAAFAATDTVAGVGSQSTARPAWKGDAEPDLLLRHQRHGHGLERRPDDGGHVHGAGQLRRQHRLHQRHGQHDVHDQQGRADGNRDR